jgi:hypothetical protein
MKVLQLLSDEIIKYILHGILAKENIIIISHGITQEERKLRGPNDGLYGDIKTGIREMCCEDVSWIY